MPDICIRKIDNAADRSSAFSAAESFVANYPDRKHGAHHSVIYGFVGGFAVAVWKTKAGNITAQQCGWRNDREDTYK